MRKMSFGELKNTELEILKFIDTVCKKNNLAYSIDSGTLLGAVRHQGFIPWDDDIDIIMVRKQYEKFIKIVENMSGSYKVISCYNNKSYFYPFAKICDSRTLLIENNVLPIENYGVYVDIFPIDAIPNPGLFSSIYLQIVLWLKYLIGIRVCTGSPRSFYKRQVWKVIKIIFSIIQVNKLGQILNKFSQKYNGCRTLYFGNNTWDGKNFKIIPWQYYFEHTKLEFEGYMVSAISNYDFLLKVYYGDYMKLPPKEKQVSNHSFIAYFINDD